MFLCVYVCARVGCVYVNVHACVLSCLHACVCVHACICVCMYLHVYLWNYVRVLVLFSVCAYVLYIHM